MSTTFPKLTNQTQKRNQKDGTASLKSKQSVSPSQPWNENDTDEVIREESIFADHENNETDFELDGDGNQDDQDRKTERGRGDF